MTMEIERKWMVSGWPDQAGTACQYQCTEYQEQGYVHAQAPIVRLRLEARIEDDAALADIAGAFGLEQAEGSATQAVNTDTAHGQCQEKGRITQAVKKLVSDENAQYVLCFKSAGLLSREEIEIKLSAGHFAQLSGLIGCELIRKVRRIYSLPGGLELEVNLVDEGLPTEFMYAEVEFSNEEQARSFDPAAYGLEEYLYDDVTEQPGQSMSAFWERTRKK